MSAMKECLYRYSIRYNLLCSNINLDTDYCPNVDKIKGGDIDGKKRIFRNHDGNLNVPCSNWNGSSLNRNCNYVSNDWNSNNRFLVLDNIFISTNQFLIGGFAFPGIYNLSKFLKVFAYIYIFIFIYTIYLKKYK